uniref:PWWP domain-containing protein 2A-like n=1 Tax=Crassostrea virginica TaxID=6565 RepID=A0A8B8BYM3_CRAVI|nr:PWWP domain-containing protein 2A-like [Crassostrea virginica]
MSKNGIIVRGLTPCGQYEIVLRPVANRTSPSRPAPPRPVPPQPAPRRITSDRWTPSVSYFSSESGNVMRVVISAPREEPSAPPAPKEEPSAEEQEQQQLAEPSAPPAPLITSAPNGGIQSLIIKRIPYGSRLVTIDEVENFWKERFHSVGVEIFHNRRNHVQAHPMGPRFIVKIRIHHNGFLVRSQAMRN